MESSESTDVEIAYPYPCPRTMPKWEDLPTDDSTISGEPALFSTLCEQLQTAMVVEMYTIPMYLLAAYSLGRSHIASSSARSLILGS